MNMPSQIRDPFYSTFAAVALAVVCLGTLAPTDDGQAARTTLSASAVPATTAAADSTTELADAALIVASIGSREY